MVAGCQTDDCVQILQTLHDDARRAAPLRQHTHDSPSPCHAPVLRTQSNDAAYPKTTPRSLPRARAQCVNANNRQFGWANEMQAALASLRLTRADQFPTPPQIARMPPFPCLCGATNPAPMPSSHRPIRHSFATTTAPNPPHSCLACQRATKSPAIPHRSTLLHHVATTFRADVHPLPNV